MKKLLLTAFLLVGCNNQPSIYVPLDDNSKNEQRLDQLEKAQSLQQQINILNDSRLSALENIVSILQMNQANTSNQILQLQNQIDVNNANLQSQISELSQDTQDNSAQIANLVSQTTTLNNMLQQEIVNRSNADAHLQIQINNLGNYINTQISNLSNTLTQYINTQINNLDTNTIQALQQNVINLTNRVNSLEQTSVTQVELNAYKVYVNNTYATLAMVNALSGQVNNLNSQVVNLQNQITNLSTLISGQSVSMTKAPCNNAKEMLLKVGNKYYAVYHTAAIVNNNGVQLLGSNLSYLGELAQNVRYVTTDGTTCYFKINSSNQLVVD